MFTVGFDTSALDDNFKEHAQRGIGRYVRELQRQFVQMRPANIQVEDFDHRTFVPKGLIDRVPVGKATLKQQILFPTKLWLQGSKDFDAFHFPAHMDAPSWCKVPYILTVLDLIPLVCADLYKADRGGWRFGLARWLENKAIHNASMILAISENTARDVERILNIEPERIRVTPLGVDGSFFEARPPGNKQEFYSRYGLKPNRPIILYVGGIDQRKNYWTLIKVLAALKEKTQQAGEPLPQLVMAGRIQSDRQFPKLLQSIEEARVNEDVVLPGFVSDEDLLHFYKISSVFCFLSLYEGFGLPALEAMAAGLPVVASNTSSIPEVLGDAGIAVNPTATVEIADAIKELLSSQEKAKELSAKGVEQASKFTWKSTAESTIAAYEDFHRGSIRLKEKAYA